MVLDRVLIGAGVAINLAAAPLVMAQDVGAKDRAAGLRLAEALCARCHAISPGQIGRHPLAPTFQDITSRYSVWDLQEALAEGILVGHASMPKFKLQPKQITELLTYMDTMTIPKKHP